MKHLLSFIGAIAIALPLTLEAMAVPDKFPDHVEQCLNDGANQRGIRGGKILGINVISLFEAQNETYLRSRVETQDVGPWSFAVKYTDESCEFVGDDFVNELGVFGDMDKALVKDWTIQNLEHRLRVVNKKEIRDGIRASTIQWHPGQIEAFKELNLI